MDVEIFCNSARFVTLVSSPEEGHHARLMIKSLRKFGGKLSGCRVTVFVPGNLDGDFFAHDLVDVEVNDFSSKPVDYPLGQKVTACAEAEKTCSPEIHTLIWFNPECLVIKPPIMLALNDPWKAAFRPVHIRNVGSIVDKPPDGYWQRIMNQVELVEPDFWVESFLDKQRLRPYFNTHLFAIDPGEGVLQRWLDNFQILVSDQAYQREFCRDPLHQIFLHQAVLSTLLAKAFSQEQIQILPPDYSYPLHLQERLPIDRRLQTLEEMSVAVYEDDDSIPTRIVGLDIEPELRKWIEDAIRDGE